MKKTLSRTLNYYSINKTNDSGASFDKMVEKALDLADTVGERYLETKDRTLFVNLWERTDMGLRLVFYTFDPGYRPKKISQKLNQKNLKPEDLKLDENEEITEIVHLFLRKGHAIIESRRSAASKELISYYLAWLLESKLKNKLYDFNFEKMAKRDVVSEIKKHGVKRIDLNVMAFDDDLDTQDRLYQILNESLKECYGKKALLSLKPKSRGILSREASIKMYNETQRTGSPGDIVFILKNGNAITKEEFILRTKVNIENDGTNNAQSFQIFSKMDETYIEWVRDGYIEDNKFSTT